MFILNLIDQVILKGFYDKVLVVHEEDVFRNRDRLVAVVDGSGSVKKFHTLAVALVLRWRVFNEGVL